LAAQLVCTTRLQILFPPGSNEVFTSRLKLFTESSEITGDNVSAYIRLNICAWNDRQVIIFLIYLIVQDNPGELNMGTLYFRNKYNTTPNGLSGNEDCGQMSAWYIFSSIGIYPMNPASGEYQIGSPIFEKSTITLADGKTFVIEAENVSKEIFTFSQTPLNGDQTSVSHKQITQGGVLHFEMGPKPNKMV
jgi:putative alpha-1,2-mannosidase